MLNRFGAIVAFLLAGVAAAQPAVPNATPVEVPAWAFPLLPAPATPVPFDTTTLVSVPGSTLRLTEARIMDRTGFADWHPGAHPPMPAIAAHAPRRDVIPCAFCHLATGAGRPENATIAGLPAEYIVRQVAEMRSGARRPAWTPAPGAPAWGASMYKLATQLSDSEVAVAAAYYASLRYRSRTRVVESARVPVTRNAGGLYALVPDGGTEPLGTRLIEFARDHALHERHDDVVGYLAYVPPGSVARGRRLAKLGTNGAATSCLTCHGPGLRGVGQVPPLAGRSPSHMLRQLLAFQTGARSSPASQPMHAVVAGMTVSQMIDAVAYAASLAP